MTERDAERLGVIDGGGTALSARAAAETLGVHERTIRRAIARGELAAVKQGRSFQITPDALSTFQGRALRPHRSRHPTDLPPGSAARSTLVALPRPPRPVVRPPTPLTRCLGRAAETAAIINLLAPGGERLVTLTGPGGVGKTRLALQVVERLGVACDGIAFVDLAPVRDPTQVVPAIAAALGMPDGERRPLRDRLIGAIGKRELLLLVDNGEHVLAAAPALADLLRQCPRLRILATSRAPLSLAGERRWPVAPLALPPVDHPGPDFGPAVALFVERAQAIAPAFHLAPTNAATIVAICRRLEGMPLALELAAAQLSLLSPGALLTRLDHRLAVLTGGPCDAPPRLRSLTAAIAWSYDLLAPAAQRLFRRLAVCVGGFSFDAVAALAAPDLPEWFDLLHTLVAHSLVRRGEDVAGAPRFRMLETIREFAWERAQAADEASSVRARQAAWSLAFADPIEAGLRGPDQAVWFDRTEAELPNLRVALAWFAEHGDGEQGLLLASALSWFWSAHGYMREAGRWLETFLALPANALTRGHALVDLANIRHWQGDLATATAYADEALTLCRAEGDARFVLFAQRRLASLAIDAGSYDRAALLLAACDDLLAAVGDDWDHAYAVYLAGGLARAAGDAATAADRFAEAAAAFGAIDDRAYQAAALGRQGEAMLQHGDRPGAAKAYAVSLALAAAIGDQVWVAWALVGAAHLAAAAGRTLVAARLLGGATAIRAAIGEGRFPPTTLAVLARGPGADGRVADAWASGMRAPTADLIADAQAIFADAADAASTPANRSSVRSAPLTPRERDVLRLLARGWSDKEIAAALGIARATAANHAQAIRGKLGVPSRAAAAALAMRDGLG